MCPRKDPGLAPRYGQVHLKNEVRILFQSPHFRHQFAGKFGAVRGRAERPKVLLFVRVGHHIKQFPLLYDLVDDPLGALRGKAHPPGPPVVGVITFVEMTVS